MLFSVVVGQAVGIHSAGSDYAPPDQFEGVIPDRAG